MSHAVYVRYTVQKGDTLWNLWRAAQMKKEEWVKVNSGRNLDHVLKVGEEIVIKNPNRICEDSIFGFGNPWVCHSVSRSSSFKPLEKYIRSFKTPDSVPANSGTGGELRFGGGTGHGIILTL